MSRKGRQFLQEKIGVTPSVAAPGDTDPSYATAKDHSLKLRKRRSCLDLRNMYSLRELKFENQWNDIEEYANVSRRLSLSPTTVNQFKHRL